MQIVEELFSILRKWKGMKINCSTCVKFDVSPQIRLCFRHSVYVGALKVNSSQCERRFSVSAYAGWQFWFVIAAIYCVSESSYGEMPLLDLSCV